ncbi:MAG: dCTP deaminase [Gammaproteobacteria bacterium]|nr:dCTP deaminase [Acholeplasmataceae bacterium]MCK9528962.1 dCTP deaminase [Gammaproteobacteria bacterium]
MSILSDIEIKRSVKENNMIKPFIQHQVKVRPKKDNHTEVEKIVSFGLSSGGYDVRLDNQFKIFTNVNNSLLDPLAMKNDYYVDHIGDTCIIPPNSYILGLTIEEFDIPRDVLVVAVGKSTYARLGLSVNVTPIEPGFKGKVVIEIANQTPIPAVVHANMGIAQFLFLQMSSECEVSYNDRNGKYQNQQCLQTAIV